MAPPVADGPAPLRNKTESDDIVKAEDIYDLNVPYKQTNLIRNRKVQKYQEYMPVWEPLYFPPMPEFEFYDPALRADPRKPNLLGSGVQCRSINPKMGSELSGIQLSQMTDTQKDELALLVSERKAVVLRDQDFADWGAANQQNFAKHFGKPNYQPVTGSIRGYPGFHVIYRDDNHAEIQEFFKYKSSATLWHHDVSYEHQPPGYVILCILECPETGGDTVMASMTEAYNRLGPGFRAMLERLTAVHSSEKLCNLAKSKGQTPRKDPVTSRHPVVRVHPVTGEKSLFVNDEWITSIEGWKPAETKWLIDFLMDYISKGHDFQIRLTWKPKTVVIFDNRSVCHTATVDYEDSLQGARHMFRLANMAEKPIPVTQGSD